MIFPGGNTTQRRTCLGIVVLAAISWAHPLQLAASPKAVVDSQAWQERFQAWVETALVQDQVQEASANLPEFDRSKILRVLDELVMKRIESRRDDPRPPSEVVPPVQAENLEGLSLEAAEQYARGDLEGALRLLEDPALERDAGAAHLRAQLFDEHTRGAHPSKRLESIRLYRYAISIASDSPTALRARLREGQIFLELGFIPEAESTLRRLLDTPPTTAHGLSVHISFAEATYLNGQSRQAIDTIVKLDRAALSPETRLWAVQRTADALFQLKRFSAASFAYRKAVEEVPDGDVDPLLRLRFATALLQSGKIGQAQTELRLILSFDPPPRLGALAGLVLARTAREEASYPEASEVAARVLEVLPRSPEAALAVVEVLEAERLAGNGDLNLPEAAFELVDPDAATPEFGLLAYRVASVPGPNGTDKQVRGWLGHLLKTLPDGAVRELAYEDLSGRFLTHLDQVLNGEVKPDSAILDEAEKFMRPTIADENALLVGLETFYQLGRWKTCMRWGAALYKREVRPIRRGLGAWREFRCRLAKEPDLVTARRLLQVADGGTSGPFSLALASMAAEELVRRGQLPKAARVYERSIASVAEPRLLGPSLLRLGELQLSLGEHKLGLRRVVRGLSLTDDAATDPLRTAGLVALGRTLPGMKGTESREAAKLLWRERKRAEDWWKPAYGYLGFRAGIGSAPEGQDLFSRAASQLKAAKRLENRIQKVVDRAIRDAQKEDSG